MTNNNLLNTQISMSLDDMCAHALQNQCEITITVAPDSTEVSVRPWKPLSYSCPYGTQCRDCANDQDDGK